MTENMTDNAIPDFPLLPAQRYRPETIDSDAVQEGQILRPSQLRRVGALRVARSILENKPGVFSGSKVEANRAVYDLTYLADWIISGPDLGTIQDDEPKPESESRALDELPITKDELPTSDADELMLSAGFDRRPADRPFPTYPEDALPAAVDADEDTGPDAEPIDYRH